MMYANYQPYVSYVAEKARNRDDYHYLNFDQLSNRELLAIAISADDDCEDGNLSQADLILNYVKGDLKKIAWLSLEELLKIEGLRYSKALSLASASTLLHKRTEKKSIKLHKKDDNGVTISMVKQELGAEKGSWLFLFDQLGKLQHKTFLGAKKNCFYNHRRILQIAIEKRSCSILLVDNVCKRPSKPSKANKNNMLRLIASASMLSMTILDHIVIYPSGYCNYRDMDWL